ncbi:MAG: Rib/alpha-like domain-containing protein, partial [Aerococcus sp.]|nr:Rib/alpha-like domain-containing protein [Aerococcus sp.]
MVGKNNKRLLDQKASQHFTKWSLRRLNVGVVSVAIASGFFLMGGVESTPIAHAATVDVPATEVVKDDAEDEGAEVVQPVLATTPEDKATAAPVQDETPEAVEAPAEEEADVADTTTEVPEADAEGEVEDKNSADDVDKAEDKADADNKENAEKDQAEADKVDKKQDDKKTESKATTGDKVASGNTHFERPGYTSNKNFSDLQFDPAEIKGEDVLKGNTINFQIYGKHNIAAATSNWEIRLQIDERLAKYITNIEIDPKSGPFSSRRTLVRISDKMGRPTNIWKVNYIRASSGLFAGAETTDTQTAPNGTITFEKSVSEILDEIGKDKLISDRLLYRIYLVSHEDGDKIVPGIESTGYFNTGDDPVRDKLEESDNNPDQFKHGSINANYEKPNTATSDNTGNTGANGAIVIDHKLTKEKNFSYGATATGTPWRLNFKVDDRLVPYIDGIELHMVNGGKVTYDIGYTTGSKVGNLSVERRKDHENYGYGWITDNDLANNLVDFNQGSPRPVVIRYVLQLNKPLDQILAEMKEAANLEGNAPFGNDFIFDAWLSDTNQKLIKGTYGTGYYYLQDIDGDGNTDDNENNDKTNPYVGQPEVDEVYDSDTTVHGKVHMNELAGKGHTAQLVTQDGTVIAEQKIDVNEEDGVAVSGDVDITFDNVDASKLVAGEQLVIRIVSPGYDVPEEGTTVIKEAPVPQDKQTVDVNSTPAAKDAIKNADNLPKDATYEWKQAPDTSKVAETVTGVVTVKIGERTFDVNVEYKVVDNRTDAEKYDPAVEDETVELGGKVD